MLKAILAAVIVFQTTQPTTSKATVGDIEFTYPAGLDLFLGPTVSEPFTLTNFNGKYMYRGVIPPNGMEITIIRDRSKAATLDQFASGRSLDCLSVSKSAIRLAGRQATKVVCDDDYVFTRQLETTVLVANGQDLYKFFLTINTHDPNEKAFTTIFEKILASVNFRR